MDSLTWFKSVFHREQATPPPVRTDGGTDARAYVPLHLAAARLRPSGPPADDEEDWDVVIARAKMQAAAPKTPGPTPPPLPRHVPWKAPSPPPPRPQRNGWADMPATPPPLPRPRSRASGATHATLDALVGRGFRK
jgi:hypothetical protein